MKRILSLVLACLLLFMLSMCVSANNKDDAEIGAGDVFGKAFVYFENVIVEEGDSVTVDLMLDSNPGITYLNVALELPEGVTVTEISAGDLGTLVSNSKTSVIIESNTVIEDDGCIAKITFTASDAGEKTVKFSSTAKNGNDEVQVKDSSCVITVTKKPVDVVEGDVNNDGKRDTTDLAVLKLFLAAAGGNDAINPDVNGDGLNNTSDLATLKLMLAGAN